MPAYYNAEGVPLPSVTTALKTLNEERLTTWRIEQSLKLMQDMYKQRGAIKAIGTQVDRLKIKETELGTWLHEYATHRIRGQFGFPELKDQVEECKIVRDNFERYLQAIGGWDVIAVEQAVYASFVGYEGREAEFAGTLDVVLHHDGRLILIDYKTARQLQANHYAQIAAYGYGWNQSAPKEKKAQALQLVQIEKWKGGDGFRVVQLKRSQITLGFELFKAALNAWYVRSGRWGQLMEP